VEQRRLKFAFRWWGRIVIFEDHSQLVKPIFPWCLERKNFCLLFTWPTCRKIKIYWLTFFLPGIAHSQFMRLRVPSLFLVGRATKPCNTKVWNGYRVECKTTVAIDVENNLTFSSTTGLKKNITYKRMLFSPPFAFFWQSSNSNAGHF
jgi:hypothetical protein